MTPLPTATAASRNRDPRARRRSCSSRALPGRTVVTRCSSAGTVARGRGSSIPRLPHPAILAYPDHVCIASGRASVAPARPQVSRTMRRNEQLPGSLRRGINLAQCSIFASEPIRKPDGPCHYERERSNLRSRRSIASVTLRSLHAVAGAPRNDSMPMGFRIGT